MITKLRLEIKKHENMLANYDIWKADYSRESLEYYIKGLKKALAIITKK